MPAPPPRLSRSSLRPYCRCCTLTSRPPSEWSSTLGWRRLIQHGPKEPRPAAKNDTNVNPSTADASARDGSSTLARSEETPPPPCVIDIGIQLRPHRSFHSIPSECQSRRRRMRTQQYLRITRQVRRPDGRYRSIPRIDHIRPGQHRELTPTPPWSADRRAETRHVPSGRRDGSTRRSPSAYNSTNAPEHASSIHSRQSPCHEPAYQSPLASNYLNIMSLLDVEAARATATNATPAAF